MSSTPSVPVPSRKSRLLTPKSVIFGLFGVALMSGFAAYHDDVFGDSLLISNHIPGGAFAYFIFTGLIWNGLCCVSGFRRLALDTKEMAVVLGVTLIACFPPAEGLFSYFFRVIMLPWHYLQGHPLWEERGLLTEHLPKYLFPSPWPGDGPLTPGYDQVYRGFFTGLASGKNTVPWWNLPWRAWAVPLAVWGPLVLTGAFAVIALQFIVHRQWSEHEQLPFPVAQVASAFCRTDDGGSGVPSVFKNKLFWWGFVPVALVVSHKFVSAWYPEAVPPIRDVMPNLLSWWVPLSNKIPVIRRAMPGDFWAMNGQAFSFTIVGIAYFVSAEVSLTMGVATILYMLFGVSFLYATGTQVDYTCTGSSRFGASVGCCAMLIFTGWTYYKTVFARALGARGAKNADANADAESGIRESGAVGAARVFMLSTAAFYIIFTILCASWIMAALFTIFMLVMFLVLSRVVSECGIPFVQSGWLPHESLIRLFGAAAVGPRTTTFVTWGSSVLIQDPRECLQPYVATAVKTADDAGVNLRRLFRLLCGVTVLAVIVAGITIFYTHYNYNPMGKGWPSQVPPISPLEGVAKQFSEMKSVGVFEASAAAGPIARLGLTKTDPRALKFFAVGLLATLGLSLIRFRFARFPLHPVLFLVGGTYPAIIMWGAFLCGWFIKTLVVRFGGGKVYQKFKPLFIGLIAGELFMVGVNMFIDFTYYFLLDSRPPVYVRAFPW
ncbi:MAG: hypothetical protein FWG05_04570 [Kiritimatiellaeota bacterium]|nr:hypothetical protein [Kiritimatiellota bacterium]